MIEMIDSYDPPLSLVILEASGIAVSLARLWRDQGKREEARELLAPAIAGSPKGLIRSI
jgi:hypothetical protein